MLAQQVCKLGLPWNGLGVGFAAGVLCGPGVPVPAVQLLGMQASCSRARALLPARLAAASTFVLPFDICDFLRRLIPSAEPRSAPPPWAAVQQHLPAPAPAAATATAVTGTPIPPAPCRPLVLCAGGQRGGSIRHLRLLYLQTSCLQQPGCLSTSFPFRRAICCLLL